MSIFVGIMIFMFGCLVGYLICLHSWIKELSNELTILKIEQAKIKAELEIKDGNDT